MVTEKSKETQLRRMAKRKNLAIKKSRVRYKHSDDLGGYQIIDIANDAVVQGAKFELSLDDVVKYFDANLMFVEELSEIVSRMADLIEKASGSEEVGLEGAETIRRLREAGHNDDADEYNELVQRGDVLKALLKLPESTVH